MAVDRETRASWSAKLGPELLFWHFLFLTYRKVGGWFLFCSLYLEEKPVWRASPRHRVGGRPEVQFWGDISVV